MSIILAIETSSRRSSIALSRDDTVLYDSDAHAVSIEGFDLSSMLNRALEAAAIDAADISLVAVDVGPGGLNAVRAGVTFANGLALSLDIPMLAARSLDIIAHQAHTVTGLPVICVRGATVENASLAICDRQSDPSPIYGSITDVAERLPPLNGGQYAVAGRFRHELSAALPQLHLIDSGIEGPTAVGLLAFVQSSRETLQSVPGPIEIIYPEIPGS